MTATLDRARKLLAPFNCTEPPAITSDTEREAIGKALIALVREADYLTLGTCADSADAAIAALESYLSAFSYDIPERPTDIANTDAIYLKFNTHTGQYHTESYTGSSRGVLVCCQSFTPDANLEMYGYVPLSLYK